MHKMPCCWLKQLWVVRAHRRSQRGEKGIRECIGPWRLGQRRVNYFVRHEKIDFLLRVLGHRGRLGCRRGIQRLLPIHVPHCKRDYHY